MLSEVSAFSSVTADNQQDTTGVRQLPILNPLSEATLAYGNYREKNGLLTDLGLYQGKKSARMWKKLSPVTDRTFSACHYGRIAAGSGTGTGKQ